MKLNFYSFKLAFSKLHVRKFTNPLRVGLLIAFLMQLLAGNVCFSQTARVMFTTPGTYTWTCPFGVTKARIACWAGGGGGGGAVSDTYDTTAGGGGGGGALVIDTVDVVPYTNYTVIVGSAGLGIPGEDGTHGGDSWFASASTVYAPGGAGGHSSKNGVGGLGAGGAGGTADACIPSTYAVGGTDGCSAVRNGIVASGAGGPGAGGSGAYGCTGTANGNGDIGHNGQPIGGGGDGSIAGPVIAFPFGGNGTDGQVIIIYSPAVPVLDFHAGDGFYLSAFPNPTKGETTVQFNSTAFIIYTIRVFDMTGREMLNKNGKAIKGKNNITLDMNGYAKGLYLLYLLSGRENQVIKLIVE